MLKLCLMYIDLLLVAHMLSKHTERLFFSEKMKSGISWILSMAKKLVSHNVLKNTWKQMSMQNGSFVSLDTA